MLKRKKTLSKLLATTMVLTSFTVNASAAEVNTSTIGGNDRYETAIKISENGWTSSDRAVLINGEKGLVDALTATPYAYAKNAPILITGQGKLTTSTKNRLSAMNVKNVDIVGGVNSVSNQVVNELKNMGITVNRISGASRYDTSLAVAKEVDKIQDVSEIAVVNGDKGIPDAVSVAAPAASKKMPILLAENGGLNSASKDFVNGESVSKSYVIGSSNSVSDSVMNSLPGTKTRLGGADRHDTNAAVIKEFYTASSLSNVYVAKSGYVKNNDEIVDALAAGVLAAKNGNPVVLVGKSINSSQQTLLAGKKFTKLTQIGMGVPANAISQIKNTQAEAEASVSSVSVVDGVTLKLSGKDLNLIDKTKVEIANNTVKSYTASASEATVVFDKEFNNGTNTLKVTSNLGKVTEFNFTYKSSLADISSVKGFTKEVGEGTLATLEVAVNGNNFATKVRDLKKQGWKVEFKSGADIFINDSNNENPSKDSTTGRLVNNLELNKTYDYEIIISKGNTKYNDVSAFKVVDKAASYKSILGNKLEVTVRKDGNPTITKIISKSNKLVLNETAEIEDIEVLDSLGNKKKVSINEFDVKSDNTQIIQVQGDKSLKSLGKEGYANITISKGDINLKFKVQVVSGERKLTNVNFAGNDKVNLNKESGAVGELSVTVTDQHGDPYKGDLLEAQDIKDNVNTIATLSKVTSDENGLAVLKFTSQNTNAGSGSINIIPGNDKIKATVDVQEKNANPTWELKAASGAKTDLDIFSPNKDNLANSVKLNLLGKKDGYITNESVNLSVITEVPKILTKNSYVIYSSNKDSLKIENKDGTVKSAEGITVQAGTKAGDRVNVIVYKGDDNNKPMPVASILINVKDSTPKATDIELNYVDTVKNAGNINVINALFDTRIVDISENDQPNNINVINGLKYTGILDYVKYDELSNDSTILYIGEGDDKIILGKIVISNNFSGAITKGSTVNIPSNTNNKEISISIYFNGSESASIVEKINVDTNN